METFTLNLTENEMQRLNYLLSEEVERIMALKEPEEHRDYLKDLGGIAEKVENELKQT